MHRRSTTDDPDHAALRVAAAETLDDVLYSAHSFTAIMYPVTLTMVLASVLVVAVNDGSNGDGAGSATLPIVFEDEAGDSGSTIFKNAFVNALVIVGLIFGFTCFMVFMLYMKYFKIVLGWLVVSTTLLLGFSTSYVVLFASQVYEFPIDYVSFVVFFYNFAVVGVAAIFYQKGLHPIVANFYLVVVSITMAWILLRILPEWTSWALLVLLALYDLFAVLAPCGPLKWLVELMQEHEESGAEGAIVPGLLYEAQVGGGGGRGRDVETAAIGSDETRRAPPRRPRRPERPSPHAHERAARVSPSPVSRSDSSSTTAREPSPALEAWGSHDRIQLPPHPDQRVHSYTVDEIGPSPSRLGSAETHNSSVKLGLGDFIFYSVLTGRAALAGFTTLIAVLLTVLMGLAMTLILLAVKRKALPALPFSIILGVLFYFTVEIVVVPLVDAVAASVVTL